MIHLHGIWWPDDVGMKWMHALKHVHSLEWAIQHCEQRRTAVQAGGNIGLWPRRLAAAFTRVITFEPDDVSRECLSLNVPGNVEVVPAALGAIAGRCDISHKSLGSHKVTTGERVNVIPLDSYDLTDLDFLQLDIEGYELQALLGSLKTIERCKPLIQVELRGLTAHYGNSDDDVLNCLRSMNYQLVSRQPGSDFVFRCVR